MPSADIPLSGMFLLFLLLFVLIGVFPRLQKVVARVERLLKAAVPQAHAEAVRAPLAHQTQPRQRLSKHLDSYEILILRRLAQSGGKGLTRKGLSAELFLGADNLKRALSSLQGRGLIDVTVTPLLGLRFYLSEQGRSYAITQDFIPQIRQSAGRR